MYRSGLLLGDGIADTVNESEGEGYVNGSRDCCAVGEVKIGEVRDDLLYLDFGECGGEDQLGLDRHSPMYSQAESRVIEKYHGASKRTGIAAAVVCDED